MPLLIKVYCDALIDFLEGPFSLTIAYVDSEVAGKTVGENNTKLYSWHRPGDEELMLLIVTSIVNTTIVSMVNAAIASLSDARWKIRQLWCYRAQPTGDNGFMLLM